MKQHKFTIIVPTRERADTLYWCLKTLVAQDYENLEILVSDNFSQDNTKEVVTSFNDKRIRYVNTGKRVEMSLNWEFGLSHITNHEGYVGFLGDDDGYLLGAISQINSLLNECPQQAISWENGSYHWPGLAYNEHILTIPMGKIVYQLPLQDKVQKFKSHKIDVKKLASIYPNGFVHSTLVQQAKKLTGKQLFISSQPDIFSALLFSNLLDSFLYSYRPYSLAGYSPKSNAAGGMLLSIQGEEDTKSTNPQSIYWSEMKELQIHPLIGKCLSSNLPYVDTILYVEQTLKGKISNSFAKKNVRNLLENSVIATQYQGEKLHLQNIEYLKAIAEKNNLADYLDNLLQKYGKAYFKKIENLENTPTGFNPLTNTLVLDMKDYHGVKNIYDVVVFVSKLLGEQKPFVQRKPYVHYLIKINYIFQRLQTYL